MCVRFVVETRAGSDATGDMERKSARFDVSSVVLRGKLEFLGEFLLRIFPSSVELVENEVVLVERGEEGLLAQEFHKWEGRGGRLGWIPPSHLVNRVPLSVIVQGFYLKILKECF
jgi:hypothetical protein